MSGYTKGPWIIRKGDEWTNDIVTHHGELPDGSPNAWNVATVNGRRDEAKANLALIAAAPDLLEAAEKVIEMNRQHAEDQYGNPEKAEGWACVVILRAAIAKARGEA